MEQTSERFCLRLFNLPEDTTEKEIETLLAEFTPIKKVWLAVRDGECAGFAWVEFYNEDDMNVSREQLNGFIWKSRLLYAIP